MTGPLHLNSFRRKSFSFITSPKIISAILGSSHPQEIAMKLKKVYAGIILLCATAIFIYLSPDVNIVGLLMVVGIAYFIIKAVIETMAEKQQAERKERERKVHGE
jgi:hypothetical protein